MKHGYLSEYFLSVAFKTLSRVEADLFHSNQHEFNGVGELKRLFGKTQGKIKFNAKFLYLNDNDDDPITAEGFLTWYDAREKHPTRSEYRLYFPTTQVSMCSAENDLLVLGMLSDNTVLVIIAESGSTIENQIRWLFGFGQEINPRFSIREELESEQDRIAFTSRLILEQIGINVEHQGNTFLDEMLRRFDKNFPNTYEFSNFARSTLDYINPLEDPDSALMSWMEREEILFRTLERYLIAERLSQGFDYDVEGFLKYSLSVQNRRKSRVGYALENHIEEIFKIYKIKYARSKVTENRSKPDFIFPSIEKYHDIKFNKENLTMLGVKSTCKDRWRQVLSEADRIENKHLLTLEAAISEAQTFEMKDRNLQLVVPRSLHQTYTLNQQEWLIDFNTFIKDIYNKQKKE